MEKLYKLRSNKNNMSYWLPRITTTGFNIPETVIFQLSEDWIDWLASDDYKQEEIQEFNNYVQELIADSKFADRDELFMKTGNFSCKFCFNFPYLTDFSKAGEQFLSIMYNGMICGCPISPEIVLREFIHTKYERPAIYNGMKLNTEFRVFYDFSNNELIDTFNYWDKDTMNGSLKNEEAKTYKSVEDEIDNEVNALKATLEEECKKKLSKARALHGVWSVDFMWDGKKFWLIDMALGYNSYYYERIAEKIGEAMTDKNYNRIHTDLFDYGLCYAVIYMKDRSTIKSPCLNGDNCIMWAINLLKDKQDEFEGLCLYEYGELEPAFTFIGYEDLMLTAAFIFGYITGAVTCKEKNNFVLFNGAMEFSGDDSLREVKEWLYSQKDGSKHLKDMEEIGFGLAGLPNDSATALFRIILKKALNDIHIEKTRPNIDFDLNF